LSAIAVRAGSAELPPFWGAFVRFALASALLFVVVLARRLPLPSGRALAGATLFGAVGFAASYALFYWGIVDVQAGLAQVLMSLIPLFTLLLAVGHRVEQLHARALAGTLLATAGIVVVSAEQLSLAVPLVALLAIVGSAACAAEAGVLVKAFPQTHIVTFNAVSMAVGAALLLALSIVTNERPAIPQHLSTWLSLAYLVPIGSVGIFVLYVFVLQRWTASATSYMFVLAPFVTVAIGVLFLGELLSAQLLLGAGLVLLGVYVGALSTTTPAAPSVLAPATAKT
jgi:drug/metabolite transporter (DMT)-like permease